MDERNSRNRVRKTVRKARFTLRARLVFDASAIGTCVSLDLQVRRIMKSKNKAKYVCVKGTSRCSHTDLTSAQTPSCCS